MLDRVARESAREVAPPARRPRRRRLADFLDPADRIGEILFGLIMVLTFTLGAGRTVQQGPEGVRELLVAALGCNVAWGLIDGVMFAMNRLSDRGRRQRLARKIRGERNAEAGLALVRAELEPVLKPLVGSELRERVFGEVRRRVEALPIERTRLQADDLLGALASFWLVFLSAIPAVLPFLFFSDPWVALRVSNLLLLALLFAVGWRWGAYVGGSRLGTGVAMLTIGTGMVLVAIALGG